MFFIYVFFMKKNLKFRKNAISLNPKKFEHSYFDAIFVTPDFKLIERHNRVKKIQVPF